VDKKFISKAAVEYAAAMVPDQVGLKEQERKALAVVRAFVVEAFIAGAVIEHVGSDREPTSTETDS
jgi:hypothetical protein